MIPIGCRPLDGLLGGGLRERIITQFYGPAGSGKSNIALQSLVNCVRSGKKAIFIDTEGSFCEKRLEQLSGPLYKKVLENTILHEVGDFEGQCALAGRLENGAGIVVVDSVTSLYRVEINDDTYQSVSRELGRQLVALLAYARDNDAPILVTNQVYADPDKGTVEPVGGDVLRYGSKVITELQKAENGTRLAVLKKHTFKKDGETARFMISEKGLFEADQ